MFEEEECFVICPKCLKKIWLTKENSSSRAYGMYGIFYSIGIFCDGCKNRSELFYQAVTNEELKSLVVKGIY